MSQENELLSGSGIETPASSSYQALGILNQQSISPEVGDNTPGGSSDPPAPLPPKQDGEESTINLVLAELREIKQQVSEIKEIKQQMSKLDKIELATESLSGKLTGVMDRTSELETAVHSNAARLREYDDQFVTLRATVDKHEESMTTLNSMKEGFSQIETKAVSDMNKLISIQKGQVDSFHATSKKVSENIQAEVDQKISQVQKAHSETLRESNEELSKAIMAEVDKRMAKVARQADFQILKDKAFNSRNNLVVVGLQEDPDKDTHILIKNFFTDSLKLKNVKFDVAYRLGSPSSDSSSSYARPIMVHFPLLPQRNRVWRKRLAVPGDLRVRIHADLPKQLRDDVQALYKVAKAASSTGRYQSASVRDYMLELDDQTFLPSELETLPFDIRPSTLAAPRSETVLAFYSKYAIFSNHHPSIFYVQGKKFHSMEEFLALRRAELAGKPDLIQRASQATDPVQAKFILSALREDNTQQWDEQLEAIVMEGLEAKFRQNSSMRDYLSGTKTLTLGEASTNPRWGVGLPIDDKNILDVTKWSESGNLLGKSLMKLRSALAEESANSTI